MQALIRTEEIIDSATPPRRHDDAQSARAVVAERCRSGAPAEREDAWSEKLERLYHACDDVGQGRTRAEIFTRVLELAEQISGGMTVDIFEVEGAGRLLVSMISSKACSECGTIGLGEGIIGEVAAVGMEYFAARIDAPLLQEREIGMRACLPLLCAGRVLGVITLHGDRGFTPTAVKLMKRLSTNAALALAWQCN